LAAVDPEWIVVSTGEPRPRFEAAVVAAVGARCRVVTTERSGAVLVRISRAGDVRVETMLGGECGAEVE